MAQYCHVQSQAWKGDLIRVDIRGELNADSISKVDSEFERRLRAGHDSFVIHLAHLTALSFAGAAALVGHLRIIQERGGSVTLVQPAPVVERSLGVLGVLPLLHIVKDTSELIGAGTKKQSAPSAPPAS